MPRFTEEELDRLCEETGATEEVRDRLRLLWVEADLTYGGAGRILGVKPEALKQMVYRLRQRAKRVVVEGLEGTEKPRDPLRTLLELHRNRLNYADHGPLTGRNPYTAQPEEIIIRGAVVTPQDIRDLIAAGKWYDRHEM